MKLKSLFLASLAAIAMASCSNEVEGVDNGNGNEVAKDAKMQLSLAFPAATRAELTDGGETYEQQINNLTVVVEYSNIGKVIQYYTAGELVEGKEEASKKQMTPAFDVASGMATVYAYVNYDKAITLENYKSYTETATYANLTINNEVAKVNEDETGNFHMNGSESKEIEKAKTNYVLIKVSRITAKLVEATVKEGYTYIPTGAEYTNKGKLSITLTDYSFVNMNTTVNTLKDNATAGNVEFYQAYNGNDNEGFVNVFPGDNRSITGTDKVSYCLANQTENYATNTNIVYKAKATYTAADNETDKGTFYVRENKEGEPTMYTLAELKAEFAGVYDNFNANTPIVDWSKLGVKKYDGGVCYYKKEVTTGEDATIVRNNLYKLNVLSISDLGTPELDTPEPEKLTLLEVEILVLPWTVINNDIDL